MPGYRRDIRPLLRLLQLSDQYASQDMSADAIVALTHDVTPALPPFGYRATFYRVLAGVATRARIVRIAPPIDGAGVWLHELVQTNSGQGGAYLSLEPVDSGVAVANEVDLAVTFNSFERGALPSGVDPAPRVLGGDAGAFASGAAEPCGYTSATIPFVGVRSRLAIYCPPGKQIRISGDTAGFGFDAMISLAFGP